MRDGRERRAFGASEAVDVHVDGLRPGEVDAPAARMTCTACGREGARAFGADDVDGLWPGGCTRLRRGDVHAPSARMTCTRLRRE